MNKTSSSGQWIALTLATVTGIIVFALSFLTNPVLFGEISADLDLTIVELGFVWGIGSFAGLLMNIPAGAIVDRLGTRRMLSGLCILGGIAGGLRAFSNSFASFMVTTLIFGLFVTVIPMNVHRAAGLWFGERRGFAAGVISTGLALGLALGSGLNSSVFSPAIGGWRPLFLAYGALSIAIGLAWFFLYPKTEPALNTSGKVSLRESLSHVLRLRELWLIGVGTLFFWACLRGMVGYLPLYLRSVGWEPVTADQTLTVFYTVSLILVMPLAITSDRYNLRREFLAGSVLILGLAVFALSILNGNLIWIAVVIGGSMFDGYMAMHQAAALSINKLDMRFAGTALGVTAALRETGGAIGSPIGNWLSTFGLQTPFIFWGIMAIIGAAILWQLPTKRT